MKMMDNVAGIVALRHCKSNVVTASVGKNILLNIRNNNRKLKRNEVFILIF